MQLVGKLTPRALGWDRNAIGPAVGVLTTGQSVLLGRIAGIVGGFRETLNEDTGEVQRGLKGNFRGLSSKNITEVEKDAKGNPVMENGVPKVKDTGVQIQITSGVCYLPGGIQEMIEGT